MFDIKIHGVNFSCGLTAFILENANKLRRAFSGRIIYSVFFLLYFQYPAEIMRIVLVFLS